MVSCTLDLSYYTPAKTVVTNEVIAAVMPKFVVKITDNKNQHLRHHTVYLIDNLEPLQFLYLKKYNLTSIASIVRFPEQACAMGE